MTHPLEHKNSEPAEVLNNIADILKASSLPLSHRDIGIRLRTKCKRIPDYEIIKNLRLLMGEGRVNYSAGRWSVQLNDDPEIPSALNISKVSLPSISPESMDRLGIRQSPSSENYTNGDLKPSEFEWPQSSSEEVSEQLQNETWATFRKLVSYYRQCIRNEEGADASAFQNEHGQKFIYLRKLGSWYPKPGLHWKACLTLGPHFSPMLNALPHSADEHSLVIGYPVQAFYKEKEGEPDIAIIRPIFTFNVEHQITKNGLMVSCDNPQAEINLGWMDFAFSRNLERQRNFLSACGFINRSRSNDEAPSLERGEISPSLENLVSALKAFMPERIYQPLNINCVSDTLLKEPFKTGVYNKAVLMTAKRTKYQVTLLKELSAIEKAPDKMLNQTALRHVFIRASSKEISNSEPKNHESIVLDTTQLNAGQRRATAAILQNKIAVITGPPGTGKSQVVSCASINARIKNQSVLFASRNHKAIDAVIGRLVDANNRALMVRTNSKDDPNLNVTFTHAIRDMLAEQRDQFAIEKITRLKDDLNKLLEERGRQATYAQKTAEASSALGELEEKISYLAEEMTVRTASHLDKESRRFPVKEIFKVVQTAHSLNLNIPRSGILYRILTFVKLLSIFPAYRKARRKLGLTPDAPRLSAIPTAKSMKHLLPNLRALEGLAKYAELREKSRQFEQRLEELPPTEETSGAVCTLSKQIEQTVISAMIFDLNSRRGLQQDVDREQLNGLKSAIKAMRTGLEDGIMRTETLRILSAQTPNILEAFPCWAVTNLSVGSRIPLVPGIFDLALMDEASQSDIPSAIPLLFRARRATVVGDPYQLTHTTKLSTAKDTMLMRKVGLKRVEDMRFAYTESSLYDLFAGTMGVEPVFLSETYRSASDIAGYSNFSFYSGRLKVATDHSKLVFPKGMKPGIHWTELIGTIKSGGGSGCYCSDEVSAVVKLVRTILINNKFRGTLGVVTPFRQQANRLRDALFETEFDELYEALERSQTHIDTAHGFQGDEKDVIIFSLCCGPDMPFGSRSFLKNTGNLFNVAVSRARAVINLVGNRDWARRCGIRHIAALASREYQQNVSPSRGPWHPHESPWEKKLYKALIEVGLKPRPQYPASSRRLDLALVGNAENPIKIDIEVDGDCHRNPDGTRKIDDIWRDIQLQGLGWKVMRFWTYQLREDMQKCVKKILKEYK